MRRKGIAFVVAVAIAVGIPAASASVWKFGNQYCQDNLAGVQSDGQGTVVHYWGPVGGSYTHYTVVAVNGPRAIRSNWATLYDIKWAVEASVALWSANTKGFCTGIS